MFYIYIIYSNAVDKYYVGQTENIEDRLVSHNSAISTYTSITKDWILVYTESFETRNEAICRENDIKRKKSRRYIEWLISKGELN
ncbi:MAG: GIY-YIG nuclease family protein [Burkholderiales bacterium]|nr:GIY-YIG nuclease family protein [Bacteroidia bacterium]